MKKIMIRMVVIACILLVTGFSQKTFAQQLTIHTVDIGIAEFNTLMSGGVVYAIANPQGSPTDFTATINPTGTGGGVDNPCVEELTPAISAQMQALANSTCETVIGCFMTAGCAYMMVQWTPDPALCGVVSTSHQQTMNAYAY